MDKADPATRALAYRIFSSALDLAAADRARFLDGECDADPALRAQVEALLEIAGRDSMATSSLVPLRGPAVEDLAGRAVGRFRLIERIGEGGMGVVYRAERIDGVRQSVAVKLVSRAMAARGQLRFARESQLLARLEHPAVARLIDAGVEEDRAWIAIEFVQGERIDAYCSRHALSCHQIVGLLVQLADAVAAAHRLLVVHSDIKPSNVMVTAEGLPKLIDFGISTTLRDAGVGEAATVNAGHLFSPGYAAPEQITGGAITVATDVFGLAALAFKLLTGQAPHGDESGPVAYMLAITQRDVPPASRAASACGRPADLVRQLRGDLDAILSKALDRDPARRYASATEFRADLQRHLDRRPVAARTPSLRYRADRFIRRNTVAVGLSMLLVSGLVAAGVVAAVQARRVAEARDVARAVTAFLTNDILAAANPLVSKSRDVQLRPLLDAASSRLAQRFAGQPTVLAEIQSAMGQGYAALFDSERAETLLLAAERGLARNLGDGDPQTQGARMALWYLYTGNIDLAKLYQVSARLAAAEIAAGRPTSGPAYKARMMLAWIPCVAKAPAVVGLSNCGGVVRPFYESALAQFGADDLTTREMQWYFGVALMYSAHEDEAQPVLEAACPGLEKYYGAMHHRLTSCRRFIAWALDSNGQPAAAIPILEQVVQEFDATLGDESQFTTLAEQDLARALLHAGRYAQSIEWANRAIHGLQQHKAVDTQAILRCQLLVADALLRSGEPHAALSLGEDSLAKAVSTFGAAAAQTLKIRSGLAELYVDAGDGRRAESLLRESLSQVVQLPNRPEWLAADLQAALAGALFMQQRRDEARSLGDGAVQVLERVLGPGNARTHAAMATLAQLRAQSG
jgi:serine/threonine-protein kinase